MPELRQHDYIRPCLIVRHSPVFIFNVFSYVFRSLNNLQDVQDRLKSIESLCTGYTSSMDNVQSELQRLSNAIEQDGASGQAKKRLPLDLLVSTFKYSRTKCKMDVNC